MNDQIEYTYNGKRVRLYSGRIVYRMSSIRRNPNAGPHVWANYIDDDGELSEERVLAKRSELQPVAAT